MAIPLYRLACNYGRLLAWSNDRMSGVWLFDDFRFDEDLTGDVAVLFGVNMHPNGFGNRYWHPTRDVKIHGCEELGNEGQLVDPPEGFIEETATMIEEVFAANADRIFGFIAEHKHLDEQDMVHLSINVQEKWHADQIAFANRHVNGGVELEDGEQW